MPLSDLTIADSWGAAISVTLAETPASRTSPTEADAEAEAETATAVEAEAEPGTGEDLVVTVALPGSSVMEWVAVETPLEGAVGCVNPCPSTTSQEGDVDSRAPVARRVIRREGTAQENNCIRIYNHDAGLAGTGFI